MTEPDPKPTLVVRLLSRLTAVVHSHPRWFVLPQVILSVLCVVYTVQQLKIDFSRNNLVGSNKKYHQNFLKFKEEFPGQDDLVAIVESDDAAKNRQFVERLGARLETETNLFTDVFYKWDTKLMGNKALLFAKESDLVEMQKMMRDYRPFIERFTQATNLTTLFQLINSQIRTAKREDNAENRSMIKSLPAL